MHRLRLIALYIAGKDLLKYMKQSKEIAFDYLNRTAQAIAEMFGPSCETLIHDFTQPGHPIIAIYNSHVSGRSVGSTSDIYGDNSYSAESTDIFSIDKDVINAQVITNTGRYIKSTTISYAGRGYHYALGINFDYTSISSAMVTLSGFTQVQNDLNSILAESTNNQLENIFNECVQLIGKPISEMKKPDRLQLISLLMQKNAFRFQKSIVYVADQLGLSRYTVYNYVHELEKHPIL